MSCSPPVPKEGLNQSQSHPVSRCSWGTLKSSKFGTQLQWNCWQSFFHLLSHLLHAAPLRSRERRARSEESRERGAARGRWRHGTCSRARHRDGFLEDGDGSTPPGPGSTTEKEQLRGLGRSTYQSARVLGRGLDLITATWFAAGC